MSDRIIAHLLGLEGWPKYTNAPRDRGGPTKGGITLATLSAHRGRPCTIADLQALGQPEAEAIYRQRFIAGPHFDAIADELLRWQVVDAGVLSGPERVTRWLQVIVGAKADGVLGKMTAAAVNAANPHVVAIQFAATRIRFLGNLVATTGRTPDPSDDQDVWAFGWANRATRFLDLEAERAA